MRKADWFEAQVVEGLPSDCETGCHPLAGFNRHVPRRVRRSLFLLANHFVEVQKRGRPAAVTDLVTAKLDLISRDAEAIKKRRI